MVQWKQRRHRPSRSEKKGEHNNTTRILLEWNKLELINGVLYRNSDSRKQIVLPKKFRSTVLQEVHNNMGHVSVKGLPVSFKTGFIGQRCLVILNST